MMRAWIGLALLSGSWLLGLSYYQPANWPAWGVVVVLGTVLLASRPERLPARRDMGVALAMLLPAVWLMPWPYRAAPLLIVIGLVLQLLRIPPRWPRPVGWGAVKAGMVLSAQALALLAYASRTARSHDLPRPLPQLLGWAASLFGVDAAVHGQTVTMHSHREIFDDAAIHYLAATWDLLVDPGTLCFFTGGLILLAMTAWNRLPEGTRRWSWVRAVRVFALVVIAWLPIRAGLLLALYMHRVLRANPTLRLTAMNQFFSPWVGLVFLLGLVLLVWRLVRLRDDEAEQADRTSGETGPDRAAAAPAGGEAPAAETPEVQGRLARWRAPAALALVACAVAIVSFVVTWDPVGRRKAGRVMFVERHSTWEPSNRPYDKEHFGHDPSYSYTRIYDYLGQYYQMSRLLESDPINCDKLSQCDVLVVKIPTARFLPDEVAAITRFVEGGGSLLLVGDHTNVFKSSTYLNDVARPFGFTFRHDLLFSIGSPYIQKLRQPAVPHPVVQHLPPMHYAVSCSIDPGRSWGRAIAPQTGLWSLPPDYNASNFHPEAEYRPEMGFGAFIQIWATRHGRGRVLAFTDSTLFSNFCTFQSGKAELMPGMIEWLNRTSPLDRAAIRVPLTVFVLALAFVLFVLGAGRALGAGLLTSPARCGVGNPAHSVSRDGQWLVAVAAGVLGVTVGSTAVVGVNRLAMPEPVPQRPMTRVVIDRTVSEAPLSLGSETEGEGRGYGLLEQWISRLGCYTIRESGEGAFSGEMLVVICPTRSVPGEFREGIVEYVARGGKLLVIDSPESFGSTSNSLLWPFGLSVSHATSRSGQLRLSEDWPALPVEATCEILGGEPFMWVDRVPVAARARYEQGSVMAIGFGHVLNDTAMGGHWMLTPDEDLTLILRSDLDPGLLKRYDLLFALLEGLMEGRPVVGPAAGPPVSTE
ncbi:MAG TPA: hypothetical protein VMY37_37025 [Thermoguttaceae bacterium]|nr:hypothetical protein [Thermoguttaceae bacterium]